MSKKKPSPPSNEVVKIETQAPAVTPKVVLRQGMELLHHLFKGTVAVCLKADKWGPLKIKSIEHTHYFHTVTSNGAKQDYTPQVAGHVHKIEWGTDPEGNLVARCGPPLKRIETFVNGMKRSKYIPIKVKNYDAVDDQPEWLNDSHTHQMIYMGSDKLTKASMDAIRRENQESIGQLKEGMVKVHSQPQLDEGFSMQDADPSTRGT